jgi:hypothetical protein
MGSFAPKGHARLDPQRPAAFAICEKCGFLYNHRDLRWDMQWRGNKLEKTGFLVCPACEDVPNQTLRPKVLPPDPVPVLNPRTETVAMGISMDETRYRMDSIRYTMDNG